MFYSSQLTSQAWQVGTRGFIITWPIVSKGAIKGKVLCMSRIPGLSTEHLNQAPFPHTSPLNGGIT